MPRPPAPTAQQKIHRSQALKELEDNSVRLSILEMKVTEQEGEDPLPGGRTHGAPSPIRSPSPTGQR